MYCRISLAVNDHRVRYQVSPDKGVEDASRCHVLPLCFLYSVNIWTHNFSKKDLKLSR